MPSVDEFAREQAVLSSLRISGHVTVTALATEFGVSTVTVRKDLEALERRGLLRRVRGGAVSVDASDEGTFEMRLRHSRAAKEAIARAAAEAVRDGDVIAIDSSTTTFYLAQELLDRRNLVVITNGLRLAMLFMQQSSARVLVPGGVVRRSAGSLVGPIGDVLAGRGKISKGFFGLVGLSAIHGLMDISVEEAQTKRFMAAACDRVYGLFDSSKVDGFGLHSFTEPGRIAGLFTDDGITAEFRSEWEGLGVPVTVAAAAAVPAPGSGRRPALRRIDGAARRTRFS
ncbi:MAG: DNA-binding transcriptional regulator of sugar metabolism, DeoR/GlpR family [Actinomycetia bacterium]|nr:DNA-binding transcriptional regulator of sugar metabolism, DeoR/GlpR family [Actinomycetes bacterium]